MQRSRLQRHTDQKNLIYSIRRYQNLPFFMKNRPKMAVLWSKIEFFGLGEAVEDPLPHMLRVLDAQKQVGEAYRSRKHNLQHGKNGQFVVKN